MTGDAGRNVDPAEAGLYLLGVAAAGTVARLTPDVDQVGRRLGVQVASPLAEAYRVAREALRVVLLMGAQERLEGVSVSRFGPHGERLFVARGAAVRTRVRRPRRRRGRGCEGAHREGLLLVVLIDRNLHRLHDLRQLRIIRPLAGELDDGALVRAGRTLRVEHQPDLAQDLSLVPGIEKVGAAELGVLGEVVGARYHRGSP